MLVLTQIPPHPSCLGHYAVPEARGFRGDCVNRRKRSTALSSILEDLAQVRPISTSNLSSNPTSILSKTSLAHHQYTPVNLVHLLTNSQKCLHASPTLESIEATSRPVTVVWESTGSIPVVVVWLVVNTTTEPTLTRWVWCLNMAYVEVWAGMRIGGRGWWDMLEWSLRGDRSKV